MLGLTLVTMGHSALHLALLAKAYYNFRPPVTRFVRRLLSYNHGMLAGGALMFAGAGLDGALLIGWVGKGMGPLAQVWHPAVFGLMLMIVGFQIIVHTLILHMMLFSRRRGEV
jgi:hypothetical protein